MTSFVYYLAVLGAILSGSLLMPALVSFGNGEIAIANRLLMYGALGGFLFGAVYLSVRGKHTGLERRSATLLAVICWVMFPLIISFPLMDVTGISLSKAVFQSFSSFTTTGSLIFPNLEAVPSGVLFMLAQFQWLGGLATLITFILVLAPWEIGGMPKVSSASDAASIVASQQRLSRYCGGLLRGYGFLTAICFAMLILSGVSAFDASILSFTALSTGGILPAQGELDLMLGTPGMIILAGFLIIGATNIFWHHDLVHFKFENLRDHRESYMILFFWIGLALFIANALARSVGSTTSVPDFRELGEGLLNAASIVSTSGVQSREGVFALLPATLVILMVMIGGGCFSTASGFRLFRVGGMFFHAEHELNRLVYPNSVQSSQFGIARLDVGFMKGIWGLFAIWIFVLAATVLALSLSGFEFQAAFTAAIAAISNAGPMYGSFWTSGDLSGWPEYANMEQFQLYVLVIAMVLGRLEIITILASVALLLQRYR